jgi:hypothetical protein
MTMPAADLLFFSHGYLTVLRRRASPGIRGSAVGFGIAATVWAVSASLTGRAAGQRGDVLFRVAKPEAPGGDRRHWGWHYAYRGLQYDF